MRIGIGIGAPFAADGTIDSLIDEVAKAEADGFAGVWMANIFSNDALMSLTLAGRVTKTIELGTFVVPTYPRHPVVLAQQALTAAAATGGRFTLGIGLSHKVVIENVLGLDYSRPVRHMREYLSVLMPLLSEGQVSFQGEEYRVAARVNVPGAPRPPVIVAALGPQMLRLAGRLTDGTGTWMGGPKYLEQIAIPVITAAAREAGRPAPRIVAGFPIAVTTKVEAARQSASAAFANYGRLPSYRAILDIEGAPDAAGVAIVGDETAVERQLSHLAAIGVTDFNASPFAVEGDPVALARTYRFLSTLARRGI